VRCPSVQPSFRPKHPPSGATAERQARYWAKLDGRLMLRHAIKIVILTIPALAVAVGVGIGIGHLFWLVSRVTAATDRDARADAGSVGQDRSALPSTKTVHHEPLKSGVSGYGASVDRSAAYRVAGSRGEL
jgi:hypothetical protein